MLGTDTVLAAQPATPVQLAHACLRAGYQQVIPASWGDELIAHAVLQRLGGERPAPAVQCSCPLVANRLLAAGPELRPFLVHVASPPVAVARYLRAAYRGAVRITYVGRCPGAAADEIDVRMTPEELFATLAARGIAPEEQPRVFDSVIPPDRRRFWSQPGGLPTAEALQAEGGGRTLVELTGGDISIELTELLLAGRQVLIDATARLGCHCAGAARPGEEAPESAVPARVRMIALEPPRSATPVVRAPELDLEPPEPSRRMAADRQAGAPPVPLADLPAPAREAPEPVAHAAVVRRKSPPHGTARPLLGTSPTTRDAEGRHLPRTYVARRRPSTPRPFRVQIDLGEIEPAHRAAVGGLATVEATHAPVLEPVAEPEAEREREVEVPLNGHADAAAHERAADTATPAEGAATVQPEPMAEAPEPPEPELLTVAVHAAIAVEEVEATEEPQPPVEASAPAIDEAPVVEAAPVAEPPRVVTPEPIVVQPVVTARPNPGLDVVTPERLRASAAQRRPSAPRRVAVAPPPSRRRTMLVAIAMVLVALGSIALGVFIGQRYFMRPVQASPREQPAVAGSIAPRAQPAPTEPAATAPAPPRSAADTLLIDTM